MFDFEEAKSAIADKPEFKIYDRVHYFIIDYVIADNKTFVANTARQTLILQNLRGTAFSKETGKIISLSFEKFHNLGECPGYMFDDIKSHLQFGFTSTEKLDGSMVRVIPINNELGFVFATRGGESREAMMAADYVKTLGHRNSIYSTIKSLLSIGLIPIFEFTSRKNRVVIDHPCDDLTLLAVRSIHTGQYIHDIKKIAKNMGLYCVTSEFYDSHEFGAFVEEIKNYPVHQEGVVLQLIDGKRIKIKGDEYCFAHKSLDGLKFEKDALKACIDGSIDDIIPILPETQRIHIEQYRAKVLDKLTEFANKLTVDRDEILNKTHGVDDKEYRKQFAELSKDHPFFSLLMRITFNTVEIEHTVKEYFLSKTTSSTKLETIRNYIPNYYD